MEQNHDHQIPVIPIWQERYGQKNTSCPSPAEMEKMLQAIQPVLKRHRQQRHHRQASRFAGIVCGVGILLLSIQIFNNRPLGLTVDAPGIAAVLPVEKEPVAETRQEQRIRDNVINSSTLAPIETPAFSEAESRVTASVEPGRSEIRYRHQPEKTQVVNKERKLATGYDDEVQYLVHDENTGATNNSVNTPEPMEEPNPARVAEMVNQP